MSLERSSGIPNNAVRLFSFVVRTQFLVDNDQFYPDIVARSSSAAEGLCRWVLAIEQYATVSASVEPKQLAMLAAEGELSIASSSVAKQRTEFKVRRHAASVQYKQRERI